MLKYYYLQCAEFLSERVPTLSAFLNGLTKQQKARLGLAACVAIGCIGSLAVTLAIGWHFGHVASYTLTMIVQHGK